MTPAVPASSPTPSAARRPASTSMYELLPEGVDDAGELSADQIYRRIVELAVEAGLR